MDIDNSQGDPFACTESRVSSETLDRAAASLPALSFTQGLAEFFKVFGDPSRLQLLLALAETPLCVCELAALSGLSASAASHQLRGLRSHRLVAWQRRGKMVVYSLADDHVRSLLNLAAEHLREAGHV